MGKCSQTVGTILPRVSNNRMMALVLGHGLIEPSENLVLMKQVYNILHLTSHFGNQGLHLAEEYRARDLASHLPRCSCGTRGSCECV